MLHEMNEWSNIFFLLKKLNMLLKRNTTQKVVENFDYCLIHCTLSYIEVQDKCPLFYNIVKGSLKFILTLYYWFAISLVNLVNKNNH